MIKCSCLHWRIDSLKYWSRLSSQASLLVTYPKKKKHEYDKHPSGAYFLYKCYWLCILYVVGWTDGIVWLTWICMWAYECWMAKRQIQIEHYIFHISIFSVGCFNFPLQQVKPWLQCHPSFSANMSINLFRPINNLVNSRQS